MTWKMVDDLKSIEILDSGGSNEKLLDSLLIVKPLESIQIVL